MEGLTLCLVFAEDIFQRLRIQDAVRPAFEIGATGTLQPFGGLAVERAEAAGKLPSQQLTLTVLAAFFTTLQQTLLKALFQSGVAGAFAPGQHFLVLLRVA